MLARMVGARTDARMVGARTEDGQFTRCEYEGPGDPAAGQLVHAVRVRGFGRSCGGRSTVGARTKDGWFTRCVHEGPGEPDAEGRRWEPNVVLIRRYRRCCCRGSMPGIDGGRV